jgi:hypothetical protein
MSTMVLSFLAMTYDNLVKNTSQTAAFKSVLCARSTEVLTGWWVSPGDAFSTSDPATNSSSSSGSGSMLGGGGAGGSSSVAMMLTNTILQKPIPAKHLTYNCSVQDLSAGSVIATLQVNSTAFPLELAGVPGTTAYSAALDELTDSLEARLQVSGLLCFLSLSLFCRLLC